MNHLTFVIPYYMNPGMLEYQYKLWASYPAELKEQIDILIVDDGSPEHPAADVPRPDGLPELAIYRIDKDIPWNQHGARNLGAKEARGPWLFLTDMDHALPAESLAKVLDFDQENRVLTFGRIDAHTMQRTRRPDGTKKPHPNSFAMTKKAYWKAGGYDEDFCGMYGTDGLFRARLYARYKEWHDSDCLIVRYGREVIPDASTTTLVRRGEGTTKGATKERAKWKQQQGREGQIVTINFPWHREL